MSAQTPGAVRPPVAGRRPVERTVHGVSVVDEYAWLRAENWREVMRDAAALAPDIRAHLEAENAYAEAVLAPMSRLRETLVAEMRGRIKEDDSSVPSPDGPFAYYSRYRDGGQHPLVCRVPRDGGEEMVLLDGDALAAGHAYFRLGGAEHSPDHTRMAWSSDDTGAEEFTIRVRDAATGADLPDRVTRTTGEVVWARDGLSFWYVRLDDHHRPSSVHRHRIGTDETADELVHREEDPGFFVGLDALQSGALAAISIHDHETSEIRLLDRRDPTRPPQLVAARRKGVLYDVEHHPSLDGTESLLVRTNAGDAEDFAIRHCPLATPDHDHWGDLIAHRPGVYVLSMTVLADWLVRLEREDGLPRIVVRRLADGEEHVIAFAEEAYSLGLDAGYEFATDTIRFTYSSMTTPTEIHDYDLRQRTRVLRKRQEVPFGHDPADYVTRRLLATAPDGATVPVSLVHHRSTPLDGSAPCLLYGYGAYGHAIPAAFSTNRLSLVDRGFIHAIAHVRGGTEKGRRWYRDGKLAAKPNTFTDFIAVAEHLVALSLTRAGRIVAQGGSAGGLTVGAVANRRPDLFAGILAEVPFVDVLATMLDDTLPLTPPEWPEWGDPIRDPEAFATIRSYSPYDNVSAKPYPAILALAGLSDPRVTYWEPAKWVARLRAHSTSGRPIVLRTDMTSGHGGAAGRFDRLVDVAIVQAFALAAVGAADFGA